MTQKRIAVVGAGMAGLAAARKLKQSGLDAVLVEAGAHSGGRARSVRFGGVVFDLGAWTFTAGGAMHALAMEAGLDSELISIPATVGRPIRGKLRVADMKRSISLVGTLCGWREIGAAKRLKRLASEVPGSSPDEIAADWAMRHFPAAFVRDVISPLGNLFFLQDISTLSRDQLLGTIAYLSKVQLLGFRHGMDRLARHLAGECTIQSGTRVVAIEADGEKVTLHVRRIAADGEENPIEPEAALEKLDGVIVAVPLPVAAKMLRPFLTAEAIAAAGQWRYAPMILVHLLLDQRLPKAALQVLPPRGRSGLSCGFTMERAKHPQRLPTDARSREAVTLYGNPATLDGLSHQSDEEILDRFANELASWLGLTRDRIVDGAVTRWTHGAAFCDPGAESRRETLGSALRQVSAALPLWTAGDYFGSSSLDGAVRTGIKAAEDCIRALS